MKEKLARGIVRGRIPILIVMLVLAGLCTTTIGKTRINYDLNRYLSGDTMTKRALKVMEEEFGTGEQLQIMFLNREEEALRSMTETLQSLPEVQLATRDPQKDITGEDGTRYQLLTLTMNEFEPAELVPRLRSMFPEAGKYYVGGSAASQLDEQKRVAEEMPTVMLISVGIMLAVLLLTSHAWLEPLVILIVLGASILINMGTNFIFPDVSFITFAVCAILQLALSIDYAIMLLHTWTNGCESGLSPREAMEDAIAQCLMRIASSAMTTVAGLLSLLFMSFTIGFDIGLVLSKGIIISMLGVFLMMPGVTLLLEKPLRATGHRPLHMGGEQLGAGIYRARKPLAAVLVALVLCGAFLNQRTTYLFTGRGASGKTETAEIQAVFGDNNPLVLLVPGGEEDSDYDRQRELVEKLQALTLRDGTPALGSITSMVTTGEAALKYYTVDEVAEMTGQNKLAVSLFFMMNDFGKTVRGDRLLEAAGELAADNQQVASLREMLATARRALIGPRYSRMLLEMNFAPTDRDENFRPAMDRIMEAAGSVYGEEYYITGVAMSTYDIGQAFTGDLMKVNIITLLAILLIVILSFRAIRLPLLLVFVIEGAIWITMGISGLTGESIFFMAYLICLAIQMGATIDYGILLCDQYRIARGGQMMPREALGEALKKSMPTVLTSGTILITAGFVIGVQCSVYYISSIGSLLSRGALISVILVLTLLPALLTLCDRWIIKKPKA